MADGGEVTNTTTVAVVTSVTSSPGRGRSRSGGGILSGSGGVIGGGCGIGDRTDPNTTYSNAAAAAGAAGIAAGAMAAATSINAAAVGGEPNRQRGRFKLRDIREMPLSAGLSSTSTTSSMGSGGASSGTPQSEAMLTVQPPILPVGLGVGVGVGGSEGSPPFSGPVSGIGSGGGGGGGSTGVASATDLSSVLLVLVEQNRQLLDRFGGPNGLDQSAGSGTGAFSVAAGSAGTASAAMERQTIDRVRTGSSAMSNLTTPQAPLPPKQLSVSGGGLGGVSGPSGGGKESPLLREGTPPGWWGQQGQSGQGQGPPPRRPSSAGLGRNEGGIGAGGGVSSLSSSAFQAGGAGVSGTGMGVTGSKVKNDGTGRRLERSRLATLLDQMKDEIDRNATYKKEMEMELKTVREGERAKNGERETENRKKNRS